MKINVETFTGLRKVLELEPGATKGATIGKNVWNQDGTLFVPASGTPQTGGVQISAWELILNIPPNVTALANTNTTGIYVITGVGASATRDIVSTDGSVIITNPDGVAGDIDLSASGGGGGAPYFVPDGENYTVPEYIQALWKLPITLGVGSSLTVLGALEQVD